MAEAAPQQPHPIACPGVTDRFGRVAAGGPIADLQRTLEQRLLAADQPLTGDETESGIAHRASRLAGPMLLITAYVAVAAWWF